VHQSLEAVIFDVDGTIADTERHGHRVAFNLAFERSGLPYRWGEEDYGRLLETPGGSIAWRATSPPRAWRKNGRQRSPGTSTA